MATYEETNAICEFLRERISITPLVGIICGSGLGQLANRISKPVIIPYKEIPGFPHATVQGHKGNLVFGTLSGKNVMVMQGRFHAYEGYTQQQITLPVRVMRLMGCEYLFAISATGGLHPNYDVGDIMVLKDHISIPALAGISPLTGLNDERFGPRFPALSDIYSKELRSLTLRVAEQMGIGKLMHEGVYVCCCGPTYDTPAEARLLQMLGADVAGMSTTAETIVAHHAGMRVLALSLVANRESFELGHEPKASHEEVLEIGLQRGETMATLLTRVLAAL
ncbi:purine nucleoside phosphorylase [Echinococcus multilocularis]|uniref:Purine nucleoside phosphorylase n=1 Tax=Echinococcus multilocularis TaxID=6211 RepID=A0A068Y9N1_ECHMU|nr:purine nucleoside phosphorylase [Echinococcus multilocularis]